MLDPVLERFAEETRQIQYQPPHIPFISSVTGAWITDAEATDPAYWVRHLRQPVQFDAGLRVALRDSGRILLEVGPGRTLASLAQRHPARQEEVPVLSLLRNTNEQLSEAACNLQALGRVWLAGVDPDWHSFHKYEPRARLPLPTYPFERQYYWVKPGELATHANPESKAPAKKKDVADWFYVRSWKRSAIPSESLTKDPLRWLVFSDESSLSRGLIQSLRECGQDIVTVARGDQFSRANSNHYRIRTQSAEDYGRLVNELTVAHQVPRRILYTWALASADWMHVQEDGFGLLRSFLSLARSVSGMWPAETIRVDVLSAGLQAVTGKDKIVPEKAAMLSASRVIEQEFPNLSCRNIDTDPRTNHARNEQRLVALLTRELFNNDADKFVAYRGHARWIENFEPIHLNDAELGRSMLRPRGTYIILGGLGHIGLTLASFLAREFQARLVLVQRSPLIGLDSSGAQADADAEQTRKLQIVHELNNAGSEVLVLSADLASESQMRNVVGQTLSRFGAIHGVIHCAGIVGEHAHHALEETGETELQWMFQSKVHGLRILEKVLEGIELDFCLLSSSMSSVLGGLGYYAYAAANGFMDAFVQQDPQPAGLRWISLNWDAWRGPKEIQGVTGLGAGIAQLAITPQEGIAVFERALSAIDIPQILVSTSDLKQRLALWASPLSAAPVPAIHAGHSRPVLGNRYVAPQTALQQSLADILQQLLGVEQIGIHDNFFELGADSLLATQAAARLRRQLDLNFPLRAFLGNPTIAAFSATLQANPQSDGPGLNVHTVPLHASPTIDQELEELSHLSEEQVEALIQAEAALQQ